MKDLPTSNMYMSAFLQLLGGAGHIPSTSRGGNVTNSRTNPDVHVQLTFKERAWPASGGARIHIFDPPKLPRSLVDQDHFQGFWVFGRYEYVVCLSQILEPVYEILKKHFPDSVEYWVNERDDPRVALLQVQGYLAHKKHPPPRTLQ